MVTQAIAADLNSILVQHNGSTFCLRVNSTVMSAAGIRQGDMVIADRVVAPSNGKIVIAMIGNEPVIRRLEITNNKKWLVAPGASLSPIEMDHEYMKIWAVVTFVIHAI
ncbi:MAG TPA: S24 family peptidase [Flavisolibacter sp.]